MLRRTSRLCLSGLILGFTAFGSSANAQPAYRVKDINPGQLSSNPFGFQELGGKAFFLVGGDLWQTDGTEAATTHVAQMGFSPNSGLVATSRRLFWLEGPVGGPLCGGCPTTWLVTSDGTQAGTGPVPVPSGLMTYGGPFLVAAHEQVLFFGKLPGGVTTLWRTDGTAGGTRELEPFPYGSFGPLCAFHDSIAFLERSAGGSTELWRSDGSSQGTVLVKTLSSRATPVCAGAPRRLGRLLIFLADDGSTGCNVWRSDGTAAGTVPLGVVGGGADAGMVPRGSALGVLVFTNFTDFWRTDGTASGTFLLKAFTSAGFFDPPGAGTREGVYFAIQTVQTIGSPDATQQLWITDGTAAGTVLLHDFKAGGEDSKIVSLKTANGRLLASIAEDVSPFSTSLWTSDGTSAGTVPIQQNVSAGWEFAPGPPAFPYRNMSLFAGTDPSGDTELWAMDGKAFAAPVRPTSLSLLNPCRVLDTRGATGFLGGPALVANAPRLFPVGGACGIPATARAIAANVTVSDATSDGLLRIHASDIGAPEATVISFRRGQTRANNATIALGPDAEFTVRYETAAPAGEVHVIVDVVGWYE